MERAGAEAWRPYYCSSAIINRIKCLGLALMCQELNRGRKMTLYHDQMMYVDGFLLSHLIACFCDVFVLCVLCFYICLDGQIGLLSCSEELEQIHSSLPFLQVCFTLDASASYPRAFSKHCDFCRLETSQQ